LSAHSIEKYATLGPCYSTKAAFHSSRLGVNCFRATVPFLSVTWLMSIEEISWPLCYLQNFEA
jgi:hypothetical protein